MENEKCSFSLITRGAPGHSSRTLVFKVFVALCASVLSGNSTSKLRKWNKEDGMYHANTTQKCIMEPVKQTPPLRRNCR